MVTTSTLSVVEAVDRAVAALDVERTPEGVLGSERISVHQGISSPRSRGDGLGLTGADPESRPEPELHSRP